MGTGFEPLTALDEEVQASILDYLAAGNFLKVACAASGITYRGFRHWQKRCEDGDRDATARFGEFFRKVARAVPVGETTALANLRRGDPGWQSQAWFLERRFPKRWGRPEKAESKGAAPEIAKAVQDAFDAADTDP